MTEELGVPVIAEGGIWEPQEACQALSWEARCGGRDGDHPPTANYKALCCGNAIPENMSPK